MPDNGRSTAVRPPLVEISGLKTYFGSSAGIAGRGAVLQAVDGVDLSIRAGEAVGLVGESGCGKSTLARTIVRLTQPTAGTILFNGEDISQARGRRLRELRRQIGMIFQDPFASLDPRQKVRDIVAEPLEIHGLCRSKTARRDRVSQLLETVGLDKRLADRYPHEFSGGQRQRIGIARALAAEPKFVICDEPVSALDVSIQAQIVNLFARLQREFDLTYLFIAHDLAVVRLLCSRIAVMYLGQIVELSTTSELFERPRHPYSASLLSAIPVPDPAIERHREPLKLSGDVPSPVNPPAGCRFAPRCFQAQATCTASPPPLEQVGPHDHRAACLFPL